MFTNEVILEIKITFTSFIWKADVAWWIIHNLVTPGAITISNTINKISHSFILSVHYRQFGFISAAVWKKRYVISWCNAMTIVHAEWNIWWTWREHRSKQEHYDHIRRTKSKIIKIYVSQFYYLFVAIDALLGKSSTKTQNDIQLYKHLFNVFLSLPWATDHHGIRMYISSSTAPPYPHSMFLQ